MEIILQDPIRFNRSTVADGTYMNKVTLQPLVYNDETIASAILEYGDAITENKDIYDEFYNIVTENDDNWNVPIDYVYASAETNNSISKIINANSYKWDNVSDMVSASGDMWTETDTLAESGANASAWVTENPSGFIYDISGIVFSDDREKWGRISSYSMLVETDGADTVYPINAIYNLTTINGTRLDSEIITNSYSDAKYSLYNKHHTNPTTLENFFGSLSKTNGGTNVNTLALVENDAHGFKQSLVNGRCACSGIEDSYVFCHCNVSNINTSSVIGVNCGYTTNSDIISPISLGLIGSTKSNSITNSSLCVKGSGLYMNSVSIKGTIETYVKGSNYWNKYWNNESDDSETYLFDGSNTRINASGNYSSNSDSNTIDTMDLYYGYSRRYECYHAYSLVRNEKLYSGSDIDCSVTYSIDWSRTHQPSGETYSYSNNCSINRVMEYGYHTHSLNNSYIDMSACRNFTDNINDSYINNFQSIVASGDITYSCFNNGSALNISGVSRSYCNRNSSATLKDIDYSLLNNIRQTTINTSGHSSLFLDLERVGGEIFNNDLVNLYISSSRIPFNEITNTYIDSYNSVLSNYGTSYEINLTNSIYKTNNSTKVISFYETFGIENSITCFDKCYNSSTNNGHDSHIGNAILTVKSDNTSQNITNNFTDLHESVMLLNNSNMIREYTNDVLDKSLKICSLKDSTTTITDHLAVETENSVNFLIGDSLSSCTVLTNSSTYPDFSSFRVLTSETTTGTLATPFASDLFEAQFLDSINPAIYGSNFVLSKDDGPYFVIYKKVGDTIDTRIAFRIGSTWYDVISCIEYNDGKPSDDYIITKY